MNLDELMRDYTPGSRRSWAEEAIDLYSRECLCHHPGERGCYQRELASSLWREGRIAQPVCLGSDGRVWDGNHRIVAAWMLGYDEIPIEEDP